MIGIEIVLILLIVVTAVLIIHANKFLNKFPINYFLNYLKGTVMQIM